VLLDILMPRTDGIEVLRQIKAIHPGCEVIMLTALSNRQIAAKAIDFGAFDLVGKPFDVVDLLAKVNSALAKATVRKCAAANLAAVEFFSPSRTLDLGSPLGLALLFLAGSRFQAVCL
jgi:DNA-binding response OmpR family regulator